MIQAWGWHESRAIRGGTGAPGADRVMENSRIVPLSDFSDGFRTKASAYVRMRFDEEPDFTTDAIIKEE